MPETVFILGKDEETYSHCYGNKCPDDYSYVVSETNECVVSCPDPFVSPMVGNTCARECGLYQIIDEKRRCYCYGGLETEGSECAIPEGKTWTDFTYVCRAAGRFVSLAGDECAKECGLYQIAD